MNDISLFALTTILFLIMDPMGNIASYLKLMEGIPEQRRYWILVREMSIALAAMVVFNYIGEFIFGLLGISETTIRLASGVILFIIALKILFLSEDSPRAHLPRGEPFIVPLAIPLIAGPSLLATIMLYANLESSQPLMLGAILFATIATTLVFIAAPTLNQYLGKNGLLALEKLMGMVLVLIAVQRIAEGVQQFVKLCGKSG